MELTPEEKQKIYLEEKQKIEARKQIKKEKNKLGVGGTILFIVIYLILYFTICNPPK